MAAVGCQPGGTDTQRSRAVWEGALRAKWRADLIPTAGGSLGESPSKASGSAKDTCAPKRDCQGVTRERGTEQSLKEASAGVSEVGSRGGSGPRRTQSGAEDLKFMAENYQCLLPGYVGTQENPGAQAQRGASGETQGWLQAFPTEKCASSSRQKAIFCASNFKDLNFIYLNN